MNNRFKRMRGNVLRKIAGLPLIVAVVTVSVMVGSPQVAAAQAWSGWLDRDDPSGKGDYETVVDFKKAGQMPCDEPTHIKCRFVGDTNPFPPGNPPNGYTCNTQEGGYCVNGPSLECRDIEVSFLCPKGQEGRTPAPSESKAEQKVIPPADKLTLSATKKVMPRTGCLVTAKLSYSGNSAYYYDGKTVDFTAVPPPAPPSGVTDAKSELTRPVKAGQTVRATTPNYPALTSNDFACSEKYRAE